MIAKKKAELQRQREQRRRELEGFREWIRRNPHSVDPKVRPAAIDWLNGSIAELDEPGQMKNTRRAGRMSLRDRLRTLVAAIIAQAARYE